ncbi:hypothetical protein GCM10028778_06130 [Barrientosiimonas marina]|uniref:Flagellar protein FlgN n=1 Tax=Lentibacillus kimchii TaxID=1542911 RepID=A0ABW2UZ05_9BACI
MSVQPIIQALEKLVKLHEGLLETARQKTEIIKADSVNELQKLLISEHKYVQALEQAEINRQKAVDAWLEAEGFNWQEPTITAILNALTDEHMAQELENTATKLTQTITSLKQQEELNQDLLRQSMQFVELSLDTISPSLRQMNYGRQQPSRTSERSVFDSRI